MRKYILIMAAVFVAVIGGSIPSASAQAPENYSAEYSSTNFYNADGILTYYFSGLNLTQEYSWLLQGMTAENDVAESFEWRSSLGSATATVSWNGSNGDFKLQRATGVFDSLEAAKANRNWSGAMRVIDSFGQVQGTHYTLPGCNLLLSTACEGIGTAWIVNGAAINLETKRFGFGNDEFVYQFLNSDGYFHPTASHEIVTTTFGDITFLHYRLFSAALTDLVVLYDLADGAEAYTFQVSDLVDYQVDDRNSILTPTYETDNFVVLNTSGGLLADINVIENQTAFENAGSRDNPHEAILFPGAYDYTLTTNVGVWIADGESALLVSESGEYEWAIKAGQTNLAESDILRVELETKTPRILTAGYADHTLTDAVEGVQDTNNYSFQTRRHSAYQVSGVAQDDLSSTWTISPLYLSQQTAATTQRTFTVAATYNIVSGVAPIDVKDRVEQTLAGFGMDSPLGRGLSMLLIMGVFMLFIAKRGARGLIPFGLVYLVAGGVWLALGLGDTITTLLFGVSALFLIFIMINSRNAEGNMG